MLIIVWRGISCLWRVHPYSSYIKPRRFYLTGEMANLCPFIHVLCDLPFSELFSTDVSSCNQYKYIEFNISLCRILIVLYKMLIITGIPNEETNKVSMYAILCQNVTIYKLQN